MAMCILLCIVNTQCFISWFIKWWTVGCFHFGLYYCCYDHLCWFFFNAHTHTHACACARMHTFSNKHMVVNEQWLGMYLQPTALISGSKIAVCHSFHCENYLAVLPLNQRQIEKNYSFINSILHIFLVLYNL